jgi:GT2 family glycosyltransferase
MAEAISGPLTWPSATVIVLNWNGAAYLPACLRALQALDYPDCRLLVVDNASTDGSVRLLQEQFGGIDLLCNPTNQGFAAGNNSALRQVETELAVLVNPDVVVPPFWLKELVKPMIEDARVGVTGGKLVYPDGALQFAGGEIHPPQAYPAHFGLGERDAGQHDTLRDVTYVVGAAMALRCSMLEQTGLLDEGYFLYYEDADFCVRARRAGYRVVYAPRAAAMHVESSATDRRSDFYWRQMFASRWRFLLKHVAAAALLGETVPAEEEWVRALEPQQRAAAAHAYYQTLRRLPEIWQARVRDGMAPPGTEEADAVARGLHRLRALAWQPAGEHATQLAARAVVEEQPFRSRFPILGRLIAGFRERWANVATRWYVRPMLAQQNQFNQELAVRLQEQLARLHAQEQAQAEQMEELAGLSMQLREMERQLHEMEAGLAGARQDNP